ncbi:MAG: glutamate-1-semialdehyde 2,1-aminomutase [Thermodesulfobacteriota bacterium]|jgi:glutamate-1-semialdehyde 2,1-aminomutase
MIQIKSKEAFERSKLSLAGGVGSAVRLREYPLDVPVFVQNGKGCWITDLDRNEYIDYVVGYGALILGHSPKAVKEAVITQLEKGSMFGACCELEFMVSEKVVSMVPCIDLVRFTNSGTEALHFVLRLARAYTGREKVIKFEGHYHGWADELFISVHPFPPMGLPNAPWKKRETPGQPEDVTNNLILLSWNDLEAVEKTLRDKGHEIAAVIMEPIMFNNGGIYPQKGYLEGVRGLTTKYGVVLIFDEIVTGFRMALGGAQEYFGIIPDLCVFGKGVAGGYPIAGFGGRREIMDLVATNEVPHMGTYNSNPLCLTAALATLQELSRNNGQVMHHISKMGKKLGEGLNHLFDKHDFPMRANRPGPIFTIHSPVIEVRNYRDYLKLDFDIMRRFQKEMLMEGIWFMQRMNLMLSAAHKETDIDQTLEAAERVIRMSEKVK